MKCHRCGSVMVYERFYGSDGHFLGWRCIQCGEIIDEVILDCEFRRIWDCESRTLANDGQE